MKETDHIGALDRSVSVGRSSRAVLPISLLILALLSITITPVLISSCEKPSEETDQIDDTEQEAMADDGGGDHERVKFEEWKHVKIELGINGTDVTKADDNQDYGIKSLTIMTFMDGEIKSLETRRDVSECHGLEYSVVCGAGSRTVVGVANCVDSLLDNVSCYEDLEAVKVSITEESSSYPIMTGEARFQAGTDQRCRLTLSPLMSRIMVRSIRSTYGPLEDAKLYLTNVTESSGLMSEGVTRQDGIMNYGRLQWGDMRRMKEPSILYRDISSPDNSISEEGTDGGMIIFDENWREIDVSLMCYSNIIESESLGQGFTRLVLEATIRDTTWYYPINVNRSPYEFGGSMEGIGRNAEYTIDLEITKRGSLDPDLPVYPGQPWLIVYPSQLIVCHTGDNVHVWCETNPPYTDVVIDEDDLAYDLSRGIYEYEFDSDRRGVTLDILKGGTGLFTIDALPPVNDGALIVVVSDP